MGTLASGSTGRLGQHANELDAVLRRGGIRAVFQPIVELDSRRPVGFEALARGPVGSPLESPDALFAAARHASRVAELDWECRHAALRAALASGMPRGCWLSLNTEPETLGIRPPSDLARMLVAVETRMPLVFEITERDVAASPADLLRTVNWARGRGFRVALDDVGTDPRVLALLPVVAPEIIKLDLRLVQQRPDPEIADIMAAVNAQAERGGAVILAEGIEDEQHLFVARSLGATLGQGWLFGRPGDLPASVGAAAAARFVAPRPHLAHAPRPTPFQIAREHREVRTGTKALLVELSKHLEQQAVDAGMGCLVLSAFQHARHFTPATVARYQRLAERTAFVAALGAAMPVRPRPGIHGGALDADDPLISEWDVVVVGPRTAGALVARDLGDGGPDLARRFEFVLTYDLPLVVRMASSVMCRVTPDLASHT